METTVTPVSIDADTQASTLTSESVQDSDVETETVGYWAKIARERAMQS